MTYIPYILCKFFYMGVCLQCFDAVGWAAGRALPYLTLPAGWDAVKTAPQR